MKRATFSPRLMLVCWAFVTASTVALSQGTPNAFLMDVGTSPPTPGPNDIYCTNTAANNTCIGGVGCLDYYTDNPAGIGLPGQTFTMGPYSMVLTSLAIRTGGTDHGQYPGLSTPTGLGPQQWELRIYSVNGANATLLGTYYSQTNFAVTTDGDWINWTGLETALLANTTNAYTFCRSIPPGYPATNNWDALGICSNNPSFYSGGEMCLIPTGGGVIIYNGPPNYSGNHLYDANFVVGFTVACCPPPPALKIQLLDSQVVLSWSSGTLLQATDPQGPWTPVSNAAPPSYTTSPTELQEFFRLQVP